MNTTNEAIPIHGGKFLQYNLVNGIQLKVPSKYQPPMTLIGRGKFYVASCKNVETNEVVAIKIVHGLSFYKLYIRKILREIRLLSHMDHENIIKIKEVIQQPERENFEDVLIAYEFMDWNLKQTIYSVNNMTDDHRQFIMYQILRGLKYIHSAGIVHEDLRPEKLLINGKCELKISDLGETRTDNGTICENPYVAPEVYPHFLKVRAASNIWSVGCIFAELFQREPLIPVLSGPDRMDDIVKVLGTPECDDIWYTGGRAADEVSKSEYPRLSSIPNMPAVAFDLLEKMLVLDPGKRVTVDEALGHEYFKTVRTEDDEPVYSGRLDDFPERSMSPEEVEEALWQRSLKLNPDTD